MCGICGFVNTRGALAGREILDPMIANLGHRGPDASGVFVQDEVGLAHTRLSIIDLSGGQQPMSNEDGSLWITFNGEIFNYIELQEELTAMGQKFATRSDTEVILHLYARYGEQCVDRLNGQWAFAIWDTRRRRLFLSRDRLGKRPLYYTQTDQAFLFASEIKALAACPGVGCELDLESLDQIFTFWVTLQGRTAFRNICQIPPGHSAIVENGALKVWSFWNLDLTPAAGVDDSHEERLTGELLDLLEDSTRIRLRSDVPVGAYLSGGIDSTVITALAKRLIGSRLRSFSVSFDEAEFDESSHQSEASAYLGTEHTDLRCTKNDTARIFPDVVWHSEQPLIRTAPAPMYHLSKLVRQSGYKVVLTGEGADEVLGGYDIFKEAKVREFCMRYPDSKFRPMLLKRLYPYMEGIQKQPPEYLKRFFSISGQVGPFFSHQPRWQLTSWLKMFYSDSVKSALSGYDSMADMAAGLPVDFARWNLFQRAQYLESTYLLPGYILSSQGDRMAMANSVEARTPFLDHRVVAFAGKLPVRFKMKVLREKYLLKRCAQGLVPDGIRKRSKQPYRAPDGQCFLQPAARDYVDELLSAESIRRYDVFDPAPVSRLLAKFRSGNAIGVKDNMALVGVLSTQLLLHQFRTLGGRMLQSTVTGSGS